MTHTPRGQSGGKRCDVTMSGIGCRRAGLTRQPQPRRGHRPVEVTHRRTPTRSHGLHTRGVHARFSPHRPKRKRRPHLSTSHSNGPLAGNPDRLQTPSRIGDVHPDVGQPSAHYDGISKGQRRDTGAGRGLGGTVAVPDRTAPLQQRLRQPVGERFAAGRRPEATVATPERGHRRVYCTTYYCRAATGLSDNSDTSYYQLAA